jgi:Inward rectifier potassium channel C-terminal domain
VKDESPSPIDLLRDNLTFDSAIFCHALRTARVAFSDVATISPHESVPTLSFRMANQRSNQILEAQLKVFLLWDELTAEEQYIRRIHDLPLVRNQSPSFALSWLALHPFAKRLQEENRYI